MSSTRGNRKKVEIILRERLYAPSIAFTLISIGRCNDTGYQTEFAHQKCIIKNSACKTLIEAPKLNGLYQVDQLPVKDQAYVCLSAMEIHRKLGHISQKFLRYLLKHGMILGIELASIDNKISSDACIKSKMTCKSKRAEGMNHEVR